MLGSVSVHAAGSAAAATSVLPMFAGLFEAKSAAAPAKGATGKKKAKPGTSGDSKASSTKAAPPKKGESNDWFTAKGPAEMGSGLSKKQRRKQRQREQKPGADQATECTSTGTSSGVHEKAGGSAIQRKMAAQLAGAHFRQINEELYTTVGGRGGALPQGPWVLRDLPRRLPQPIRALAGAADRCPRALARRAAGFPRGRRLGLRRCANRCERAPDGALV